MDTIKVKYWSFIPRRGSGRTDAAARRSAPTSSPARPSARATGSALSAEELTAMFAETRARGDRGHAPGRRRAARRARGGARSRSSSTATSTSPTSARSAARSAASARASARPTPTSTTSEEFVARIHEALEFGASELCIQSGIHPDWQLEDYLGWLRLAKRTAARQARSCTCTRTARWRSRTCATSPGCRRRRCSRA